jgi:hypothetical protein
MTDAGQPSPRAPRARMRATTLASSGMRLAYMTSAAEFTSKFLTKCRRISMGERKDWKRLTSGFIGLLTGPHQTLSFDDSSSTMRLSDGERPVLAPEYAESAPEAVMAEPVS